MPARHHDLTDRVRAKDIMRRRVITLRPELSLQEAAKILVGRRISGAPVVDATGTLMGVVSQTDLVRYDRDAQRSVRQVPTYYRASEQLDVPRGFHLEVLDEARVRDIMTPALYTATEEAPIEAIGRFMLRHRVHRVLVTRARRLRGIITSMDLVRGLLRRRRA